MSKKRNLRYLNHKTNQSFQTCNKMFKNSSFFKYVIFFSILITTNLAQAQTAKDLASFKNINILRYDNVLGGYTLSKCLKGIPFKGIYKGFPTHDKKRLIVFDGTDPHKLAGDKRVNSHIKQTLENDDTLEIFGDLKNGKIEIKGKISIKDIKAEILLLQKVYRTPQKK